MKSWIYGAAAAALCAGPALAAEPKCDVFSGAREQAQCACALRVGGHLSQVNDRWRVVYVRRHQERFCHNEVEKQFAAPK